MKTFFHPRPIIYISEYNKNTNEKKISGILTGSKSLEHIENGNLFCFVYMRPEEITDSASLALQITK